MSTALTNSNPSQVPAHLQQYVDHVPNIGVRIPTIQLRSTAVKQAGIKLGHYFMSIKHDKDEDPEIIDLGTEFKAVVLRHAMVANYYKKPDGMMMYSSEFKNWTTDPIIIFDRRDGNAKVAAFSIWSGKNGGILKELKDNDKRFSELKISRVSYVFLPDSGKIARMSIGNRDWNGCNEEGNCDYNNDPIEGSFGHYIAMTNKHMRGAPFCAVANISTRSFKTVDDDGNLKDDYAKYFDVSEVFSVDHPAIATADSKVPQALNLVTDFLIDNMESSISYAMGNTDTEQIECDTPVRITALQNPRACAELLLGKTPSGTSPKQVQAAKTEETAKALEDGDLDKEVDLMPEVNYMFGKTELPPYAERVDALQKMKKVELDVVAVQYQLSKGKTKDEAINSILLHEYPHDHKDATATPEPPDPTQKMIDHIMGAGSLSELKRIHATVLDGCEDEKLIAAYDKRHAELEKAMEVQEEPASNDTSDLPW